MLKVYAFGRKWQKAYNKKHFRKNKCNNKIIL